MMFARRSVVKLEYISGGKGMATPAQEYVSLCCITCCLVWLDAPIFFRLRAEKVHHWLHAESAKGKWARPKFCT